MLSIAVAAAVALFVAAPTQAAPGAGASQDAGSVDRGPIDAYTATVTPAQRGQLAKLGQDLSEQDQGSDKVSVYLTPTQAAQVRKLGINVQLTKVKGGKTVREFAADQALNGYTVWRSYDEAGGIRDQLYAAAANNPSITKLVRLGTTGQGREILALRITQGARGVPDGSRPAVLYSATQHAREWISTEVDRRLMNYYLDKWRANDPQVKSLLQRTELWFVLVANPDGYQYTFDHERLWRKNLRDNNGDGKTTVGDGVDPNRNYPNRWGYDNEGSSNITSSETYRGTSAGSEPETVALKGLLDRIRPKFQVNWHSAGQWLLYPEGWQTGTATADDPIYYALAGNLDNPAIPGFQPGLSSDVLYVTNGETNGYAHTSAGTLAWTPELSPGCDGCGFVFPDDPALVEQEFQRVLPFASSVARSAVDPANPLSTVGIATKPFYIDSDDPYKRGVPGAQLSFRYSYGDPQPVAVNAKRSLGAVTVKYRINGGPVRSAPTSEWAGGEKYTPAAVYYHQMRGVVTGTSPGDSVEVWFEGGGATSDSFTYQAVSESGRRVLVVAAEDYTGASPAQTPGPHYASAYVDALAANGIQADVYDTDARGRIAPDALGVLSHYDAVVTETGDDIVTRRAGTGAGNADRLALDQLYELRAYLNEGGKVLLAGNDAVRQYSGVAGNQLYDPKGEIQCNPLPANTDPRRCLNLIGSGDNINDVMQYVFGAYSGIRGDGIDENGAPFDSVGTGDPFSGLTWGLDGANQTGAWSFLATSGALPPATYPQFTSAPSSRWNKPGGPFEPHSGAKYIYSQVADVSYKRFTKEIAVPAGGGQLSFWTSYSTEEHWDHLFVEARTPNGDNWTTLPDVNGATTTDPGDSCPAGWRDLHPQLDHYQTLTGNTCTSTGTTGAWNAASGSSNGWRQWKVDLGAYAGKTVEISLSYASDWATQGVGVFLDDVTYPDGTTESFESGLGGWVAGPAPAGSSDNANTWERIDSSGFPVGNSITTPDTILLGFGLEGVSTAEKRAQLMGAAMGHLLS
ncbi:M14 family metallopeptidase [Intrasporangium mesophilum]